jgi:hypothetical protein
MKLNIFYYYHSSFGYIFKIEAKTQAWAQRKIFEHCRINYGYEREFEDFKEDLEFKEVIDVIGHNEYFNGTKNPVLDP